MSLLDERLAALRKALDEFEGHYRKLRGAASLREYLAAPTDRADEEILTEPILRTMLREVLGFPRDGFFEQLGKSGKKPDFTPNDLIAHPFVLDAKGSGESLKAHEAQIRGYMTQRRLDFGVLFNLREVRVYRSGARGHDRELSFPVLPLWEHARGDALPADELARFEAFCQHFAYQELALEQKIARVAHQESWASRLDAPDAPEIDVEALVERLRLLSRRLAEDAGAQVDRLDDFLGLHPGREQRLLDELRLLALDIAPGTEVESLPTSVEGWRAAAGLPTRVWRQYLLRVSYLALTRILLYRAWEDVQLVDEYLHDGGFERWYAELDQSVGRVLREAFLHGSEQYPWLYGRDNNYDWYRPRPEALVEVLYRLVPEPLGKLDADVLGALYESYVDEIDRDRLGQFFTPRDVVRFMLDRAGFSGPEGVFKVEGDERKPRQVLDFATGSGGFLVEAARRVIDDAGIARDDDRGLREALRAIVNGFVGGEISPFPYYLTEVNVLLQVSRLLGYLRVAGHPVENLGALGVLHVDTLTAKTGRAETLDELDPEKDRERLTESGFDLVPLDGEKLETYRTRLREDAVFDLVVGNPPYVAEANNKPLFDRLRAIPAWKGIYRGKTDYLYYFLLLAAEKVAPGGKLCVITPAGWMNAGAADFLRERLASELRLDELFLFGAYRVFATEGSAPTPTVESAILVATRVPASARHKLRVVALEDEAAAPDDRRELLDEMARRARGRPGRKNGIHVHDVLQAELRAEYPWPIKHAAADVASRVVAHLEGLLTNPSLPVEPMGAAWKTFLGIQTGADTYSRKILARLDADVRRRLEGGGARLGDPIYALPPGLERANPWLDAPNVLVKSPEPEGILYGVVDPNSYVSLVWLTKDNPPPETVLNAVERWRPLLANRAEFVRNPQRSWWETCWPRNRTDLRAPKVIALHRTDRGRFALDEEGEWSPSGRMSVVVGRYADAPVAYLCGLLNSELLDLWYAIRGRAPWHVRRDYEPKPMNAIPYRQPAGDPRADEIAELVRRIAANRRALLRHAGVALELTRTVKDPWKTGPVEVDERALADELDLAETVSVRLDPRLEITGAPAGKPARPDRRTLVFTHRRVETGRIVGDPQRLDLLARLLPERGSSALTETLLPSDLSAFERRLNVRREEVGNLLAEGRRLVEEVERLVCALYGLPDELADEVVAHAVARAASSTPSG